MQLLYTLCWYLALPVLLARLWWRGRLAPAYRARWRERLAWGLPQREQGCVWIHAVSVGETLAAVPLIEKLLIEYPDTRLLVTTTTPTGSERVRHQFGDRVDHVYCPWDLPGALKRFFSAFNPRLILVMETELWPNLVAQARQRQVPVVLVNGRLSEKSYRGYARLGSVVRPMMQRLSLLLVQAAPDAERFRLLGAEAVEVTGSIKFDLQLTEELRSSATRLKQQFNGRPVWIAASTHPGEDEMILAAHAQVLVTHPDAALILVPRHPERFNRVAEQVTETGMTLARRSADQSPSTAQVYLGDTMGELLMLFGVADVALVAGSLLPPLGGHNLLEPAAWSVPVLSGPHLQNFSTIAQWLQDAEGLVLVDGSESLGKEVSELLADPGRRQLLGQAACAVVEAHRGALARVLQGVAGAWPSSSD